MSEIEDNIGFMLVQICKAHRNHAATALNELGLHAGQEMILVQLWQQDGASQSQLAEAMCVEPPTITKMVSRMENIGLLERRPDPDDARVSRVYLTPKSRALRESVLKVWQDLEMRLLSNMNEMERALLRRLLLQVYANLSE